MSYVPLPVEGVFARDEIQSDIPTNSFGPFIGLNGLLTHLQWNSILQFKIISVLILVTTLILLHVDAASGAFRSVPM